MTENSLGNNHNCTIKNSWMPKKLLIKSCSLQIDKRRTISLDNIVKNMELEVLKERIQNKHKLIVREIDDNLDKVFDDFLNEVNKISLNHFKVEKLFFDNVNIKPQLDFNEKVDNNRSLTKDNQQKLVPRLKLPEKTYMPRNSLLTDLFQIKHLATIYHIFIVILTLLFLNTFVTDFVDTGKINIGLRPIITGFGGISYGLLVWLGMQLTILAVFPVFKFWASITKKHFNKSKGFGTKLWHSFWLLTVICYQVGFVTIFTKGVYYFDMKQASSVAVLMELTRFVMKSHAFIRTNVPRVLNSKNKLKIDDEEVDRKSTKPDNQKAITGRNGKSSASNGTAKVNDKSQCPSFNKYLYFLFAPTLVYRDEYPRTKQIRWRIVAVNYVEVLAVIFYMSFISESYMFPVYNQFGSQFQQIGLREFILSIFNSMLPGLLAFLCGFYLVLHSWMNAAAEMLRFADRKFYADWWNSASFAVYYRTWNVIVHDWLYLYVYKDLYEYVFKQNKVLSQFLVFTLSAIVHEYILGFTFRFCYPVMFVLFEFAGIFLMFVTKKEHKALGNIFMWLSLTMGMGLMLSLYHMEYYARKNCDFDNSSLWNYFVPISWSCNGLKYSEKWEVKIHF